MANIGTAYVQIEPTAKGISGKIEQELGGMGASGGAAFSSGFAKVLGGTGKALAGTLAIGTAAVTAMGGAFVNATSDVASYGDNIDKMSQKMGMSAQSYQEWDAVMQHSGTSMETMKSSMKTLASAAETGKDAFDALGISQEQIARMSQEQLFEATISALQQVDDETQRTYLAGQLLGRGATELGALLNTSAEETQAMRDRVRELGGVMSDEAVKASAAFQDQLQDMQTAFQGLSRNMLSEFLPDLTTVMGGLTEIFSGNSDKGIGMITEGINSLADKIMAAIPQILKVGMEIVKALGDAIIQNLPTLLNTAVEVAVQLGQALVSAIPTVISALIEAAPMLIDGAMQLLMAVVNALPQIIEVLIAAIPQIITMLVTALTTALPQLISGAIQLVLGIVQALPQIIMALIDALPTIITQIVTAMLQSLPILITGLIQLMLALVTHLPEIIISLIEAIPTIMTSVVNAFVESWPELQAAFIELGQMLLQLLQQMGSMFINNIVPWLQNLGTTIVNFLKELPGKMAYFAGEMVAKFINFLVTLPSKVQEVWNTFLTNLKAFGQKMISEGPNMAREFGQKLIDGLKSLPEKLVQVGHNIVEGLKNGIKNAWGNLTAWVGDLCSNFVKGFTDNLQIGSPSKVFRDEVGVWIPAGIAEGIEDGMSSIDTAMADMTAEMLPDQMSMVSSAAYTPTSGVQTSESQLYSLLARYLPVIAEGNNVNVSLEGNAQGLFNLMRQENKVYKRMSGQSAFA